MINETVGITESVSIRLELYFELVEPVAIPRNFKDSNEITLCVDDDSILQSFKIKLGGEQKDWINTVHKANRFVNYLSFKTGLYVSHKHPRKIINGKIITSKTLSFDALLTTLTGLDLTERSLNDFLSNTSLFGLAMAHFASGQRALNGNNFAEAIREFYLTIEDSKIVEEEKYLKLRNAVSHIKIGDPKSPDILRNEFNINLLKGDSLDITDPIIDGKLEKAAKEFREVSWNYLNSKLIVSKTTTFKHTIE